MWLSKQLRSSHGSDAVEAEMGVTTIGGQRAGVYTRGEVRDLPVCTPGGVVWQPKNGDQVLVLKGGPGGEEQFVLGLSEEKQQHIADGELLLSTGSATIHLCNSGRIDIVGDVWINGEKYKPCNCGALG